MPAAHLLAPAVPVVTAAYRPGCSGKVAASKVEAAATLARRRSGGCYQCRHCGAWHTSHLARLATGPPRRPSS